MKRLLPILVLLALVAVPVVWASSGSEGEETVAAEEGAGHGEGHEEKTYFGIPGGVLKFFNLVLFVGVLVFLLKKSIQQAFSDRKSGIQKQLAEAEERRKKADSLAEDIQERLSQIEGEVEAILSRAREEGERQKKEIVTAAAAESEKILFTAKSQIDQRLKQARRELTEYAGELASNKAQSMIEDALTEQDRSKLFAESVEKIGGIDS